ncbi:serine protease H64 [Tribolium castaneum]|uniref:Serine protease H64 n=1 Tax=Tribolium castaneum TaxID=7070 RepID=D6WVM2_TRICA|nr:PREDICTED: chymotrypsin BI [Tribolium castaneum]EFA09200.1 serine protease H64 [Tribolium castaneum]|eukprot:XP_008196578.1 PREDICTED: chymotrypsin BI [Tribolium castaneum]
MWFSGALIAYLISFSEGAIRFNDGKTLNEPKVINGNDAQKGQFPWQVEIMSLKTNNRYIYCGGAIISHDWVLTSAVCLDQVKSVTVFSGINDLNDISGTTTDSKSYIVHEEFDSKTLQNNVGLVKLKTSLIFDENTKAISLSSDVVGDGVNVTISGWGHSNKDYSSNITAILQYTSVSTIKNSECAKFYGSDIVTTNVLCTYNPDLVKSPCVNDGGAPLITNPDTDPQHVGIFSFIEDNGCEQNYPAVYTRTAQFLNWIKNKTGV